MKKIKLDDNPFLIFKDWYQLATSIPHIDPSAAALATATSEGFPSVRIVLLKEYNEKGFVFYTNLKSRKAMELALNPKAALCFYWSHIHKQIRIEGDVVKVSEVEADRYYASRSRESQIGAWASLQSAIMDNPDQLCLNYAEWEKEFNGKSVPRPPHWSGFRIIPNLIEYWSEGDHRLHERVIFEKTQHQWIGSYFFP